MTTENRFVGARIPGHDFEEAERLVQSGRYLNLSDLLRRALREKLDKEEVAEQ
jgi:Arc/MetJ-type ribon-helix-helix transcriptional regulator